MDWDKLKVEQVWETDSSYGWLKVVEIWAIFPEEIAVRCFGEDGVEYITKEDGPNFTKLLKDAE